MQYVSDFFEKYPHNARLVPVKRIFDLRSRYPEVFGFVMMSCVKKQGAMLATIWNRPQHQDAFEVLAARGHFKLMCDPWQPDAQTYLDIAVAAVERGRRQ